MTNIISNGGGFVGTTQDSVERLVEIMGETPLDRSFENYGNFIYADDSVPDVVCFFGNFFHLSHVFNIETNSNELVETLTAAIQANQRRGDYLSQPQPARTHPEIETLNCQPA